MADSDDGPKKLHYIKDKATGKQVGYTLEGTNGNLLIYLNEFRDTTNYFHGECLNFAYYCTLHGWNYTLERVTGSMFGAGVDNDEWDFFGYFGCPGDYFHGHLGDTDDS